MIETVGYKLKSGAVTSCGHDRKHVTAASKLPKSLQGTRPYNLNDKPQKNGTSGVRGVTIRHRLTGDRYIASLTIRGKYIYGGTFDTMEKAIEARHKLEEANWTPLLARIKNYKRTK